MDSPQNLPRWLAAGVVAGLLVIGIAVGAYFVGYNRGESHRAGTPATTTTTTAPATTTQATSTTTSTVPVTPSLVAQGTRLYKSDGCSACHSLDGTAGAGPSFKGLAGSSVALTTGQTVTADDAYLARSIEDPDAEIVKGYSAGVMSSAISAYGLAGKPADVKALVAFIKSQK